MAAPDLSVFPEFAIVENIANEETAGQDASTSTMSFRFCVLFLGKPWNTLTLDAPGPEEAAITIEQIIRRVNAGLVRMGYPPNMCSWASGACQL